MAKAKAINFELIDRTDGSEPYAILDEMRRYHRETREAMIALAWRMNLNPDADSHLILGKCVKASDLQRELSEYDFVILLNREVWFDDEFTADKKRALMDHELCHAAVSVDKDNVPRRDERGRLVFRTRKHDIEEFQAIVHRHGCYKKDLEVFADALLKKRKMPLLGVLTVAEQSDTAEQVN
jgi:hypothetical protein